MRKQASSSWWVVGPPGCEPGEPGSWHALCYLFCWELANIRRMSYRTEQRTMENLHDMQLTIPVAHMALFVALLSFCLLFARYKLGLSITFCFTFYWGFIYNKDVFFTSFEGSSPFLLIYFLSGFLLILFALFSFVSED